MNTHEKRFAYAVRLMAIILSLLKNEFIFAEGAPGMARNDGASNGCEMV